MSCVEGETQATIAKKLGVSQQYVARCIKVIREKCQRYITASHGDIRELFDALAYKAATTIPRSKRKDAGYARHRICYPSEFLMKVSMTGDFYKGKYRLKNYCAVPDYLRYCFDDSDTKCSLCYNEYGESTCSRKPDN